MALAHKVSRERVGTELEGMFNGPSPLESVRLLENLGLFSTVFSLPDTPPVSSIPSYGEVCVACMESALSLAGALKIDLEQEDRRFLLISSLMMPLRHLEVNVNESSPCGY